MSSNDPLPEWAKGVEAPLDICETCGHSDLDHVKEEDNAYCLGGTPCRCSEFTPRVRGIVTVMITPGEGEYEEKA